MKVQRFSIIIAALLLAVITTPSQAMYHAGMGKFLQRDPLNQNRPGGGYHDGMNQYQYVKSDPVKYVDPSGLILVAVDGTGSRGRLKGGSTTATGKWFSHVRNFYDDYTEVPKKYYHGPDWANPWGAGMEVNEAIKKAKKWLCSEWCKDQQQPIDMIGHSRGGFTVLELARALKDKGCCCKGTKISPVPVRFLGLYDPVDMAWGVGGDDSISNNVQHAFAVYPRPEAYTRQSFRRARVGPEDATMTDYAEIEVLATHGAIGGAPFDNRGLQDRLGALSSDKSMRRAARKAGVRIRLLSTAEYGYEIQKWYDKENK